ncbi:MAG: DUF4382 domain-containing protein [Ignavibacteria bacterium]|nr:DUF4382 domain-containing protein [Ignavibacteria bacterium]
MHAALKCAMMLPIVSLIGCTDAAGPEGQGEIRMYLVDSPGSYEKVNIVITRVEVHKENTDTASGWFVINSVPGTYDLLQLRNGVSAVLGSSKLDAGRYTQIRLIIGEGSHVVINGANKPLKVPSGMQTGLKLVHGFQIEAGSLYELILDFDAERSVVRLGGPVGGEEFILKPTVRVQAVVTSGSISGTVLPVAAKASVWTTVGQDTVFTTADTTSGAFKLVALPEGTYTLRFTPSNTAYRDTTISGVAVVKQQDKNIGTITLSAK